MNILALDPVRPWRARATGSRGQEPRVLRTKAGACLCRDSGAHAYTSSELRLL